MPEVKVVQFNVKSRDLTRVFGPDRRLAITGVACKTVRVWNQETGECIRQLNGHKNRMWGLAWSSDQSPETRTSSRSEKRRASFARSPRRNFTSCREPATLHSKIDRLG